MLRALCFATAILVLPLEYASADAGPALGGNAALEYWQAFATLPKLTDAEQTSLNAEFLTMPLDAHARELVTRADYALKMMHYGAALPRCDWGYPYEEGTDMLLPQGPASRVLSALACLRARMRFEEGQHAAAIDDIVAGLTLGRHASRDGINIMVLVGYGIERRMGETLALYVPRLNAQTIKELKTRLDKLPASGTPATAMKFEEKSAVDWFVRKVKEAKDRESLLALLSFVSQLAEPEGPRRESPEKARAFLQECGGSADGVLKFAAETHSCYGRMAQKLELPLDQFGTEWGRETQNQAGNPVFKVFFPAIEKMRWQQARADIRRALLSAALAVQVDGRDALKDHPDPVVGGPFEYVAVEGGFELRSKFKLDEKLQAKWKMDDKPLALAIGVRGK